MMDKACAQLGDPAERFAVALRLSGRLAWTHPEIAGFITGAGLDLLDARRGLAPRGRRDIRAGQEAGRFSRIDPEITLSAVAGALIGLLKLQQRQPEWIQDDSVDELAEACLRLLGIRPAEARRLARTPLPALGTW